MTDAGGMFCATSPLRHHWQAIDPSPILGKMGQPVAARCQNEAEMSGNGMQTLSFILLIGLVAYVAFGGGL